MVRLSPYSFIVVSLGLLMAIGCASDQKLSPMDNRYAPLETGRYWVYQVQEERYAIADAPVNNTYYLKETIGETLETSADSQTYKLIRSRRNRVTDSWKADSVWTVQQWPDKLIRTENNTAYVTLRFPITSETSWNQNVYNTLSAAIYRCTKVGAAYTTSANTYANTIQVVNTQDDSTAISLRRQVAVYAYQTGLVFSENTTLAYCQSSPDCIGKGQIASGSRQRRTLIETGSE